MQKNPTIIVAAVALLREDKAVLLQKRPEGRSMAGLWEFPGGKLEADETAEVALVREIKEELAVSLSAEDLKPACFASAYVGDTPLLLLLFICRKWQGEPQAIESPELGWFQIHELYDLPMPPADVPMIELLAKLV